MKTPHKHAELLRAISDGKQLQRKGDTENEWIDCSEAAALVRLSMDMPTRIKPEPKPDFCALYKVSKESPDWCNPEFERMPVVNGANLVLTFDGETGALKAAEVLK